MARFLGIFCAAFTICFIIGFHSEYKSSKEISDRDFLLKVASRRFVGEPDNPTGLVYKCDKTVLYQFDFSTSELQEVTVRPYKPYPSPFASEKTEINPSYETIALVAAGWGLSDAAVLARMELGFTGKDKLAALLGSLSGYAVGRIAASRKVPVCDAPQTLNFLATVTANQIAAAIIKERIERNLLLFDDRSTVTLTSQIDRLKKKFSTERVATKPCIPYERLTVAPDARLCDFEAIEKIEQEFGDSSARFTFEDYLASINAPRFVTRWAMRDRGVRNDLYTPRYVVNILTRESIVDFGDSELQNEKKVAITWYVRVYRNVLLPLACVLLVVVWAAGSYAIFVGCRKVFFHWFYRASF
jgi:hypothetical protein